MKVEKSGAESDKPIEPANKGKGIRIGSFVIISFLLLYIPSLFHWIYGDKTRTDIIRMGMLEDSINTEACIIRSEEVLESPYSGKCITEVGEGDKVPRNFKVATVLSPDYVKLIDRLAELDLDILKMQKEKSEKEEFFSEDIVKIDKSIGEKINLVIQESNTNNLLRVRQLKSGIDELIQKKAAIVGNTGAPSELLNTKKQDRESLQHQINSNKKEIISIETGVISFTVDGYESSLRPEAIEELTPDVLDGIKIKESKKHINNLNLEAGKPFAKIIKEIDYQIAIAVDEDKVRNLEQGDFVIVRVNEIGRDIKGAVSFKSESFNGRCVVTIGVNEAISETARMRKINIDLIECTDSDESTYKGLKVPMSSLIDVDPTAGTAKIILVKANYSSIRNVKIIMNNDEYAIIKGTDKTGQESVSLYDRFVVNPENIQEGQAIN